MSRKPQPKPRDLSASKRVSKQSPSPYTRSIYESSDSPPNFQPNKSNLLTPQRASINQDYNATRPKQKASNNLNYKIDSIIKQNGCLLNENNKLIQLLRQKQHQLHILQGRLEQQLQEEQRGLILIEQQKNRILIEVKQQLELKQKQIDTLIEQVKILTEQIEIREEQHKLDIMRLKEDIAKENHNRMQNLKRSQISNMEICENQLSKMKQVLMSKQDQIEQQQHEYSLKQKRMEEEIRILNSELKHSLDKKVIELQQLKLRYETELTQLAREKNQQRDIQNANYQNMIKRIKKQLGQKTLQNQRLNFRLEQTATQNQAEYDYVQQQKVKAEVQMQELELKNRLFLENERTKWKEMKETELENLQLCHQNLVKSFEAERQKIIHISEIKSAEIEKLNIEINSLKQGKEIEIQSNNRLVEHFKQKLQTTEQSNIVQIELLKVKMAQLHSGDIQGLMRSYQEQIVGLSELVSKLEQVVKQNRQKLHEQLSSKTEMRKYFEIELSKQQNNNAQLKAKLQAKHLELRSSLDNIRSQHELTSESAIRQRTSNKKDLEKREADIKKFYELINAKDVQIQQLNDIIQTLKKDFEEELNEKGEEIVRLKAINLNLEKEQKKEKQFYEKELKKKDSYHKDEKEQLEEELANIKNKTYQQLMNDLNQIQKQKLRLEAQLAQQKLDKQNLQRSQQTHKQMIQVIKLESSSALQQQKQNSSKKASIEQARRTKLHIELMKSKDKQIEQLKRRLFEKDGDTRDAENKTHEVEKKLQVMMDGQGKLRELEIRAMNLGMDNNLVKNTSQLFKYRKK